MKTPPKYTRFPPINDAKPTPTIPQMMDWRDRDERIDQATAFLNAATKALVVITLSTLAVALIYRFTAGMY
tara:strand:+ start:533 stop:745 length:213 start_codon:yes stop_codon:yes gene_type:complete